MPRKPSDQVDPLRLAALFDALSRGIVLTRERLAEALEDAVRRGRMTRDDAEELTATLVGVGRQQAQDLLRAARLSPRTKARKAIGAAKAPAAKTKPAAKKATAPRKAAASSKAAAAKKPAASRKAASAKKPAASRKAASAKKPAAARTAAKKPASRSAAKKAPGRARG